METRFYSSKTICERLDIGRSTINKWQETRGFPSPIRIGNFCNRWKAEQVDAWINHNLGKPTEQ